MQQANKLKVVSQDSIRAKATGPPDSIIEDGLSRSSVSVVEQNTLSLSGGGFGLSSNFNRVENSVAAPNSIEGTATAYSIVPSEDAMLSTAAEVPSSSLLPSNAASQSNAREIKAKGSGKGKAKATTGKRKSAEVTKAEDDEDGILEPIQKNKRLRGVVVKKEPAVAPRVNARKPAAVKGPKTRAPPMTKPDKINLGATPFPKYDPPTRDDFQTIHDILLEHHKNDLTEGRVRFVRPEVNPDPMLNVSGCGEVPLVLDGLLRTSVSIATSAANSDKAIKELVRIFGTIQTPEIRETVNWDRIHASPEDALRPAFKQCGLWRLKARTIKGVLDWVAREDEPRRLASAQEASENGTEDNYTLLTALEHLHNLSDEAAMKATVKYDGVGVKVAACVALFSLRREVLPVDTHVARMAYRLAWAPDTTADATFFHINYKAPNELKYGLHNLLFWHGMHCEKCKDSKGKRHELVNVVCPIEQYIVRTGPYKQKGGKKGGKKVAKVAEEAENEVRGEEEEEAEEQFVVEEDEEEGEE